MAACTAVMNAFTVTFSWPSTFWPSSVASRAALRSNWPRAMATTFCAPR